MKEQKNEKIKYFILIIIIVLIVSFITLSFAYLAGKTLSEASSDVKINLSEQAEIKFTKGDDLNISAGAHNMTENGNHLVSTTTASVTLTAYGNYTSNYYLYFNVLNNDFEYTTDEKKPELILQIKGPNGVIISVPGLDHIDDGDVIGFDITTFSGLLEIGNPEVIELNDNDSKKSSITEQWEFTIYFMNLDTDQYKNFGKIFDSEIIIDIEKYDTMESLSNMIFKNEGSGYETVESAIESIELKDYNWGSALTGDTGLYATIDQTGNNSYFYTGSSENNYVDFAGYYWRIVRIDGDGNIKLIYYGEDNVESSLTNKINTSLYNDSSINLTDGVALVKSFEGVGYVYTDGELDGIKTSSTVKEVVDAWYDENIVSNGYSGYVANTLYCTNRVAYESDSGGNLITNLSSSNYFFDNYLRLYNNYDENGPTLICNGNENDQLTLSAGLISADEASFASGVRSGNTSHYLAVGNYWTLTPAYGFSTLAYIYFLNSGSIDASYGGGFSHGVRPTISLKPSVLVTTGSGTITDPYEIYVS